MSSVFGLWFYFGMVAHTGWPRKRGLLRKQVVNSVLADSIAHQLADAAQALGSEHPQLGLRLLTEAFLGRDWERQPPEEIATFLAGENVREWSPLADIGEAVPWDVMSSPQMQMVIASTFAANLWYGLTEPEAARRALNDKSKGARDRGREAARYGLDIDPEQLPESVRDVADDAVGLVASYEEEEGTLPDAPDVLVEYVMNQR
jgi:hypothetical protein